MPFISSVRGNYGAVGIVKKPSLAGGKSDITGGTITTAGGFRIHTFTSPGTLNTTANPGPLSVQYLIVGGGGGGGISWGGGGGGAGGFRTNVPGATSGGGAGAEPAMSITPGTYPIAVGAGGGGGGVNPSTNVVGPNNLGPGFDYPAPEFPGNAPRIEPGDPAIAPSPSNPAPVVGQQGSNSSFNSITSIGGGGGGGGGGGPTGNGTAGGSGGGGSFRVNFDGTPGSPANIYPGSPGTPGQGFPGGGVTAVAWNSPLPASAAGGGGAGDAGQSVEVGSPFAGPFNPGNAAGGAGVASSITGSPVVYASGGSVTVPTPAPTDDIGNAYLGTPFALLGGGGGGGPWITANPNAPVNYNFSTNPAAINGPGTPIFSTNYPQFIQPQANDAESRGFGLGGGGAGRPEGRRNNGGPGVVIIRYPFP